MFQMIGFYMIGRKLLETIRLLKDLHETRIFRFFFKTPLDASF